MKILIFLVLSFSTDKIGFFMEQAHAAQLIPIQHSTCITDKTGATVCGYGCVIQSWDGRAVCGYGCVVQTWDGRVACAKEPGQSCVVQSWDGRVGTGVFFKLGTAEWPAPRPSVNLAWFRLGMEGPPAAVSLDNLASFRLGMDAGAVGTHAFWIQPDVLLA